MAEPVSWSGALLAKYGPTALGLVIGTAAKYGLTLSEGKRLTLRGVIADLLLLGALGFIAIFIGDMAGRMLGVPVSNDIRVLTGSLAAVSSDRLVRLAREAFLKRTESELARLSQATNESAMEVPAGTGEPEAVGLQPTPPDDQAGRAGAALKRAFRASTRQRPPEDQIELLRRMPSDV